MSKTTSDVRNIYQIDGRELSRVEINEILETVIDSNIRRKAFEAIVKGGDLIANDLKELVIKRNNFAQRIGYSSYFEYMLKVSYNVELNELEILLDNIYEKSKNLIKEKLEEDKPLQKKLIIRIFYCYNADFVVGSKLTF